MADGSSDYQISAALRDVAAYADGRLPAKSAAGAPALRTLIQATLGIEHDAKEKAAPAPPLAIPFPTGGFEVKQLGDQPLSLNAAASVVGLEATGRWHPASGAMASAFIFADPQLQRTLLFGHVSHGVKDAISLEDPRRALWSASIFRRSGGVMLTPEGGPGAAASSAAATGAAATLVAGAAASDLFLLGQWARGGSSEPLQGAVGALFGRLSAGALSATTSSTAAARSGAAPPTAGQFFDLELQPSQSIPRKGPPLHSSGSVVVPRAVFCPQGGPGAGGGGVCLSIPGMGDLWAAGLSFEAGVEVLPAPSAASTVWGAGAVGLVTTPRWGIGICGAGHPVAWLRHDLEVSALHEPVPGASTDPLIDWVPAATAAVAAATATAPLPSHPDSPPTSPASDRVAVVVSPQPLAAGTWTRLQLVVQQSGGGALGDVRLSLAVNGASAGSATVPWARLRQRHRASPPSPAPTAIWTPAPLPPPTPLPLVVGTDLEWRVSAPPPALHPAALLQAAEEAGQRQPVIDPRAAVAALAGALFPRDSEQGGGSSEAVPVPTGNGRPSPSSSAMEEEGGEEGNWHRGPVPARTSGSGSGSASSSSSSSASSAAIITGLLEHGACELGMFAPAAQRTFGGMMRDLRVGLVPDLAPAAESSGEPLPSPQSSHLAPDPASGAPRVTLGWWPLTGEEGLLADVSGAGRHAVVRRVLGAAYRQSGQTWVQGAAGLPPFSVLPPPAAACPEGSAHLWHSMFMPVVAPGAGAADPLPHAPHLLLLGSATGTAVPFSGSPGAVVLRDPVDIQGGFTTAFRLSVACPGGTSGGALDPCCSLRVGFHAAQSPAELTCADAYIAPGLGASNGQEGDLTAPSGVDWVSLAVAQDGLLAAAAHAAVLAAAAAAQPTQRDDPFLRSAWGCREGPGAGGRMGSGAAPAPGAPTAPLLEGHRIGGKRGSLPPLELDPRTGGGGITATAGEQVPLAGAAAGSGGAAVTAAARDGVAPVPGAEAFPLHDSQQQSKRRRTGSIGAVAGDPPVPAPNGDASANSASSVSSSSNNAVMAVTAPASPHHASDAAAASCPPAAAASGAPDGTSHPTVPAPLRLVTLELPPVPRLFPDMQHADPPPPAAPPMGSGGGRGILAGLLHSVLPVLAVQIELGLRGTHGAPPHGPVRLARSRGSAPDEAAARSSSSSAESQQQLLPASVAMEASVAVVLLSPAAAAARLQQEVQAQLKLRSGSSSAPVGAARSAVVPAPSPFPSPSGATHLLPLSSSPVFPDDEISMDGPLLGHVPGGSPASAPMMIMSEGGAILAAALATPPGSAPAPPAPPTPTSPHPPATELLVPHACVALGRVLETGFRGDLIAPLSAGPLGPEYPPTDPVHPRRQPEEAAAEVPAPRVEVHVTVSYDAVGRKLGVAVNGKYVLQTTCDLAAALQLSEASLGALISLSILPPAPASPAAAAAAGELLLGVPAPSLREVLEGGTGAQGKQLQQREPLAVLQRWGFAAVPPSADVPPPRGPFLMQPLSHRSCLVCCGSATQTCPAVPEHPLSSSSRPNAAPGGASTVVFNKGTHAPQPAGAGAAQHFTTYNASRGYNNSSSSSSSSSSGGAAAGYPLKQAEAPEPSPHCTGPTGAYGPSPSPDALGSVDELMPPLITTAPNFASGLQVPVPSAPSPQPIKSEFAELPASLIGKENPEGITCALCKSDNAGAAVKCVSCDMPLPLTTLETQFRWVCTKCLAIHAKEDSECMCSGVARHRRKVGARLLRLTLIQLTQVGAQLLKAWHQGTGGQGGANENLPPPAGAAPYEDDGDDFIVSFDEYVEVYKGSKAQTHAPFSSTSKIPPWVEHRTSAELTELGYSESYCGAAAEIAAAQSRIAAAAAAVPAPPPPPPLPPPQYQVSTAPDLGPWFCKQCNTVYSSCLLTCTQCKGAPRSQCGLDVWGAPEDDLDLLRLVAREGGSAATLVLLNSQRPEGGAGTAGGAAGVAPPGSGTHQVRIWDGEGVQHIPGDSSGDGRGDFRAHSPPRAAASSSSRYAASSARPGGYGGAGARRGTGRRLSSQHPSSYRENDGIRVSSLSRTGAGGSGASDAGLDGIGRVRPSNLQFVGDDNDEHMGGTGTGYNAPDAPRASDTPYGGTYGNSSSGMFGHPSSPSSSPYDSIPASNQPEWSCSQCTYLNVPSASECAICTAARPAATFVGRGNAGGPVGGGCPKGAGPDPVVPNSPSPRARALQATAAAACAASLGEAANRGAGTRGLGLGGSALGSGASQQAYYTTVAYPQAQSSPPASSSSSSSAPPLPTGDAQRQQQQQLLQKQQQEAAEAATAQALHGVLRLGVEHAVEHWGKGAGGGGGIAPWALSGRWDTNVGPLVLGASYRALPPNPAAVGVGAVGGVRERRSGGLYPLGPQHLQPGYLLEGHWGSGLPTATLPPLLLGGGRGSLARASPTHATPTTSGANSGANSCPPLQIISASDDAPPAGPVPPLSALTQFQVPAISERAVRVPFDAGGTRGRQAPGSFGAALLALLRLPAPPAPPPTAGAPTLGLEEGEESGDEGQQGTAWKWGQKQPIGGGGAVGVWRVCGAVLPERRILMLLQGQLGQGPQGATPPLPWALHPAPEAPGALALAFDPQARSFTGHLHSWRRAGASGQGESMVWNGTRVTGTLGALLRPPTPSPASQPPASLPGGAAATALTSAPIPRYAGLSNLVPGLSNVCYQNSLFQALNMTGGLVAALLEGPLCPLVPTLQQQRWGVLDPPPSESSGGGGGEAAMDEREAGDYGGGGLVCTPGAALGLLGAHPEDDSLGLLIEDSPLGALPPLQRAPLPLPAGSPLPLALLPPQPALLPPQPAVLREFAQASAVCNRLQWLLGRLAFSQRPYHGTHALAAVLPEEFRSGKQHDVTEFFHFLTLNVDKALTGVPEAGGSGSGAAVKRRTPGPFQAAFGGRTASVLVCRGGGAAPAAAAVPALPAACGHVAVNSEGVESLQLRFPESRAPITGLIALVRNREGWDAGQPPPGSLPPTYTLVTGGVGALASGGDCNAGRGPLAPVVFLAVAREPWANSFEQPLPPPLLPRSPAMGGQAAGAPGAGAQAGGAQPAPGPPPPAQSEAASVSPPHLQPPAAPLAPITALRLIIRPRVPGSLPNLSPLSGAPVPGRLNPTDLDPFGALEPGDVPPGYTLLPTDLNIAAVGTNGDRVFLAYSRDPQLGAPLTSLAVTSTNVDTPAQAAAVLSPPGSNAPPPHSLLVVEGNLNSGAAPHVQALRIVGTRIPFITQVILGAVAAPSSQVSVSATASGGGGVGFASASAAGNAFPALGAPHSSTPLYGGAPSSSSSVAATLLPLALALPNGPRAEAPGDLRKGSTALGGAGIDNAAALLLAGRLPLGYAAPSSLGPVLNRLSGSGGAGASGLDGALELRVASHGAIAPITRLLAIRAKPPASFLQLAGEPFRRVREPEALGAPSYAAAAAAGGPVHHAVAAAASASSASPSKPSGGGSRFLAGLLSPFRAAHGAGASSAAAPNSPNPRVPPPPAPTPGPPAPAAPYSELQDVLDGDPELQSALLGGGYELISDVTAPVAGHHILALRGEGCPITEIRVIRAPNPVPQHEGWGQLLLSPPAVSPRPFSPAPGSPCPVSGLWKGNAVNTRQFDLANVAFNSSLPLRGVAPHSPTALELGPGGIPAALPTALLVNGTFGALGDAGDRCSGNLVSGVLVRLPASPVHHLGGAVDPTDPWLGRWAFLGSWRHTLAAQWLPCYMLVQVGPEGSADCPPTDSNGSGSSFGYEVTLSGALCDGANGLVPFAGPRRAPSRPDPGRIVELAVVSAPEVRHFVSAGWEVRQSALPKVAAPFAAAAARGSGPSTSPAPSPMSQITSTSVGTGAGGLLLDADLKVQLPHCLCHSGDLNFGALPPPTAAAGAATAPPLGSPPAVPWSPPAPPPPPPADDGSRFLAFRRERRGLLLAVVSAGAGCDPPSLPSSPLELEPAATSLPVTELVIVRRGAEGGPAAPPPGYTLLSSTPLAGLSAALGGGATAPGGTKQPALYLAYRCCTEEDAASTPGLLDLDVAWGSAKVPLSAAAQAKHLEPLPPGFSLVPVLQEGDPTSWAPLPPGTASPSPSPSPPPFFAGQTNSPASNAPGGGAGATSGAPAPSPSAPPAGAAPKPPAAAVAVAPLNGPAAAARSGVRVLLVQRLGEPARLAPNPALHGCPLAGLFSCEGLLASTAAPPPPPPPPVAAPAAPGPAAVGGPIASRGSTVAAAGDLTLGGPGPKGPQTVPVMGAAPSSLTIAAAPPAPLPHPASSAAAPPSHPTAGDGGGDYDPASAMAVEHDRGTGPSRPCGPPPLESSSSAAATTLTPPTSLMCLAPHQPPGFAVGGRAGEVGLPHGPCTPEYAPEMGAAVTPPPPLLHGGGDAAEEADAVMLLMGLDGEAGRQLGALPPPLPRSRWDVPPPGPYPRGPPPGAPDPCSLELRVTRVASGFLLGGAVAAAGRKLELLLDQAAGTHLAQTRQQGPYGAETPPTPWECLGVEPGGGAAAGGRAFLPLAPGSLFGVLIPAEEALDLWSVSGPGAASLPPIPAESGGGDEPEARGSAAPATDAPAPPSVLLGVFRDSASGNGASALPPSPVRLAFGGAGPSGAAGSYTTALAPAFPSAPGQTLQGQTPRPISLAEAFAAAAAGTAASGAAVTVAAFPWRLSSDAVVRILFHRETSTLFRAGVQVSSARITSFNPSSMLAQLWGTEVLAGPNRRWCDACGRKCETERTDLLLYPRPPYLNLTVSCFNYTGERSVKNRTRVALAPLLEVPPIPQALRTALRTAGAAATATAGSAAPLTDLDLGDGDEQPTRYGLYAVVLHSGESAQSGHYFSYARRSDAPGGDLDKQDTPAAPWVYFNDTTVDGGANWARMTRDLDGNPGLSPYLLLYKRLDGPGSGGAAGSAPISLLSALRRTPGSSAAAAVAPGALGDNFNLVVRTLASRHSPLYADLVEAVAARLSASAAEAAAASAASTEMMIVAEKEGKVAADDGKAAVEATAMQEADAVMAAAAAALFPTTLAHTRVLHE